MDVLSGRLFVISSPSGGGKSSVIDALRKRHPELAYSVSATTRPPRRGERDGVEYTFLSEEAFEKRIAEGAFLEWAVVHGHRYGTLKEDVYRLLDAGRSVLLDIDVQGGLSIKEADAAAVLIFLLPPSMETLRERLESRGTDSADVVAARLANAAEEMNAADSYDFQVWNRDLDTAVEEVAAIIETTLNDHLR